MSQDLPQDEPLPLTDELAQACWDEAADAWDRFVETGADYYRTELHGPALLEHCGDVAGQDVLDLGCGQGWFSRQLAAKGARVTGIDWSPRLVAHARRHLERQPLPITYRVLDAAVIDEAFAAASFELVTGCMSLMDMPDPARVLGAAAALLRPGGRIVFSIPNPITDAPHRVWRRDAHGVKQALEIDRYFDTSPRIFQWRRLSPAARTVQYRYTLEQWSRMFEAAGLLVRSLREARPGAAAIARRPELADAARLPYFLSFALSPAG